MRSTVIMPVSGLGGGGSTVPVIPAPGGEFYAAISYFTGRVGDYDDYAYGYVKNSTEFSAEFCHPSSFANFNLYTSPDGSERAAVPASSILGFHFGNRFDLTAIPTNFLAYCYSFNQPLTIPQGVTKIWSNFMYSCYTLNQPLTIPHSVTSIEANFMNYCISFNQPLAIPQGAASIGNNFMSYCYALNQPLTIPRSVTSIGSYFMSYCYTLNQPLTIPQSITSIGSYFALNCRSLRKLIVECASPPTDIGSLSVNTGVDEESYINGIILSGTHAARWKAALPDRSTSPYRKLILE